MSHPVLQVTHPSRYRVFFYSNSAAFVTSLVIIMMLQSKYLLNRHTLEATLVLDLFSLVTAYGAGSTRDVNTSIYIVALAGLVLVYVIVHITIRDHAPEPAGGDAVKDLDDKRKVLLLAAILAATLTYQAGLTPPGGFWLADDQGLGRHAGFPVLFNNYPRRYNAFFYCNATSFMASIILILLLVNPKLYRPGIRCYALYVCMLVGMFGLMGAYAAGSARQLKTSIYVLTLHNWNYALCRVPEILGKGPNTLGKTFAENYSRQRPPGVHLSGKQIFAESHLSDTRQRLCRVSNTVTRQRKVIRRNGANGAVGTWRRWFAESTTR